jgi:hypothetical protein
MCKARTRNSKRTTLTKDFTTFFYLAVTMQDTAELRDPHPHTKNVNLCYVLGTLTKTDT